MKSEDIGAKKRAFCRAYLETMDPAVAAGRSGIADGYAALESKTVQRTLQRMRAVGGDVRREDVIRRLCALAFAPVNDAIRLAYLDDPGEAAVARLDLSPVAEFRRNSAGSVEVRFVDRIKALDTLYGLLGGADGDEAADFLRALETAEGTPWEE